MQYLNLVGKNQKSSPVLVGSAVRAIGKGWKVGFLANKGLSDPRLLPLLCSIKDSLIDSTALSLYEDKSIMSADPTPNLILVDGHMEELEQELKALISKKHSKKHHLMISREQVQDMESEKPNFDLVSLFSEENVGTKKLGVTTFTGSGKGKTTSALGLALLNSVNENHTTRKKVFVTQWFKEKKEGAKTWAISEHFFNEKLTDTSNTNGAIEFFCTGLGFYGSPHLDRVKGEEAYQMHRNKAYEGVAIIQDILKNGDPESTILVLDEFLDTAKEVSLNIPKSLVDLPDVEQLLQDCASKGFETIATGRRVLKDRESFMKGIKTSVTIEEIKHPWSSAQKPAISGLDF